VRASARCVRETDGRVTPPRCDAAARRSLVGERPEHVHPRRPRGRAAPRPGAGHQADDDQHREAADQHSGDQISSLRQGHRSPRRTDAAGPRLLGRSRRGRSAGACRGVTRCQIAPAPSRARHGHRNLLPSNSCSCVALPPAAEDGRACSDGQAGISVHASDTLAKDEDQASAGGRSAPAPLLHLSRSSGDAAVFAFHATERRDPDPIRRPPRCSFA
jgi:hypothetical protein